MKYSNYIESDSWLDKSADYLIRHQICELCHKHKATHAHHTRYDHIGEETDDDIMGLCERCHIHIHLMPPVIDDKVQLKKAINLMNRLNDQPVVKTIVLNKVADKYYNGAYMLELASARCENTAFFLQNLMEIFYEDGKEKNEDIIEFALQTAIKTKIDATKIKMEKERAKELLKKRNKNGELKRAEPKKHIWSKDIMIENSRKVYRALSNDKNLLKKAKSYMNTNYYHGEVFFNLIGCKDANSFTQKIKNDGLLMELYDYLFGGNQ